MLRSVVARSLIVLIRGYQLARAGRPSACRYLPTCSNYALEAISAHGAVRGTWLSARRIGRCHPWGGMGFDPVPGSGGTSSSVPGSSVPSSSVPGRASSGRAS